MTSAGVDAGARPSRIVGVDVARGLAVLGMFGAHVGARREFDWADPGSWAAVVNGRSAILFALLAGVSLAILSGGRAPLDGDDLTRARLRILTRGMLVVLLGIALELLDTGVAVILTYYGLYFVLALPVLRVRPAVLFAVAGAVAIAAPFAVFGGVEAWGFPADAGPLSPLVDLLLTGYYPAVLWIAFVLAGLGIGRLDLADAGVRLRLLTAGVALSVAGYGIGGALAGSADGHPLLSLDPHSGSTFEAVGSGGVAIAVLALCLIAGDALRLPLFPLAAVGSMALTVYAAQLLAIDVFDLPVPGGTDDSAWAWFTLAALLACTIWALTLGRGPLERLLTWSSRLVARTVRTEPQP
jgi:uncharacterized membrane protein YeiB